LTLAVMVHFQQTLWVPRETLRTAGAEFLYRMDALPVTNSAKVLKGITTSTVMFNNAKWVTSRHTEFIRWSRRLWAGNTWRWTQSVARNSRLWWHGFVDHTSQYTGRTFT